MISSYNKEIEEVATVNLSIDDPEWKGFFKLGNSYQGIISIQFKEDFEIKYFGFNLVIESRGRVNHYSKGIQSHFFCNHQMVKKGEKISKIEKERVLMTPTVILSTGF